MGFLTAVWLGLALSPLQNTPTVAASGPVYVRLADAQRVHGRLATLAPDALAPERRRGVLHLLAALMRASGTPAQSAPELEAWFAEQDARVQLDSDGDQIVFVYDCPPEQHAAVFDRLVDWARGATIDEGAAQEALAAYVAELRAAEEALARPLETRLVAAALGAGSWPEAHSRTLAKMPPSAITEVQGALWGRASTFCSATGPGDGAAWLARAAGFLEAQPDRPPARARPPRGALVEHPLVIDDPQRSTSEVRVVWDAYVDDADYAALWLWTEIATREEDTNPDFRWTSVPSLLPRSEIDPPLYVFGVTDSHAVLSELERLQGFLARARELEEPKFLLLRRAVARELRDAEGSAEERLRRAQEALRDRAPEAIWEQRLLALESLDYASYREVTARALARPLRWVAVGPAHAIARWPAEVEVRSGHPETASTPAGRALAARVLEATGGRAAWSALHGFHSVRSVLVAGMSEPIDVHIWVDFEGARVCVEQNLPGAPLVYVLHERSGWQRVGSKVADLGASAHGALWQRQERTLFQVLRALARDDTLTLRAQGERRLEIHQDEGLWCWLTLDERDRPERLGYQIPGERLETEYLFGDWAESQGLAFPRHVHQLERGTETQTLSQEFNPSFAAELFERP